MWHMCDGSTCIHTMLGEAVHDVSLAMLGIHPSGMVAGARCMGRVQCVAVGMGVCTRGCMMNGLAPVHAGTCCITAGSPT